MEKEGSRIHGRLLMATGVLHIILAVLPGVFGTQFLHFAAGGFFNVSGGVAEFPLFGGSLNYEGFAAFWFFYAGVILLLYGHALDLIEKAQGYVPLQSAIAFIVVSLLGAYMVPLSGMTFILLPQAVYMYLRSRKQGKAA